MVKIQTKRAIEEMTSYPLGFTPEELMNQYHLKTIRKMSDNENIYGCSPNVRESIIQNMQKLFLYPDGKTSLLIQKLSAFYNLNAEQLIIGNGSEELIRLLTRAFINPGDEAVLADMTFPRYEANIVIEGGISVKVPLANGVHDLPAMYEKITPRTKMIFICNPNNPTGTIVEKQELYHFIEKVPENILIVLDEAYYEYVTSNGYLQSVPLIDKHSNLVILRTFSKIYGLAGLRVGYGIMNSNIVHELHKVKDVFNVNQLAQTAAVTALENKDFILDCADKNDKERIFVCEFLEKNGLNYYPSQTNFVFIYCQFPVVEKLISNGFLVRELKYHGYTDAFRITLGTREDNKAFLEVISQIISERAVENGNNARKS
ncbi:histidinol-phosphate transaminase [Cytobacillus dafuensis]|uniref:Histidinol-phosphate aminotransferase n=1 Tax=Cytobacillus dafuensis TaxID=1742359 RepID=A0A5B8Z3L8_CYTDA|nr:histidinol-phosphate transaminase [Cytobacillus dafuensis]QED47694.1 histidinol-phosphate transaminase [Cytobacillus dafuensis]